jgi:hypothetical protein
MCGRRRRWIRAAVSVLRGVGSWPANERGEVVEPGFFEGATSERALLYARLRAPESAHGRAKKP